MDINQIFDKKIKWKAKDKTGILFESCIDGKIYTLKINDFPDEPMYTLTDNIESIDFDDKPESWKLQ